MWLKSHSPSVTKKMVVLVSIFVLVLISSCTEPKKGIIPIEISEPQKQEVMDRTIQLDLRDIEAVDIAKQKIDTSIWHAYAKPEIVHAGWEMEETRGFGSHQLGAEYQPGGRYWQLAEGRVVGSATSGYSRQFSVGFVPVVVKVIDEESKILEISCPEIGRIADLVDSLPTIITMDRAGLDVVVYDICKIVGDSKLAGIYTQYLDYGRDISQVTGCVDAHGRLNLILAVKKGIFKGYVKQSLWDKAILACKLKEAGILGDDGSISIVGLHNALALGVTQSELINLGVSVEFVDWALTH